MQFNFDVNILLLYMLLLYMLFVIIATYICFFHPIGESETGEYFVEGSILMLDLRLESYLTSTRLMFSMLLHVVIV